MKVLVCGGRHYANRYAVFETLDKLEATEIVCGGCSGADDLAVAWAKARGKKATIYFPDWELYGRAAGPKRNKTMLWDSDPDAVLAFPGGKGTANMVALAKDIEGLRIIEF